MKTQNIRVQNPATIRLILAYLIEMALAPMDAFYRHVMDDLQKCAVRNDLNNFDDLLLVATIYGNMLERPHPRAYAFQRPDIPEDRPWSITAAGSKREIAFEIGGFDDIPTLLMGFIEHESGGPCGAILAMQEQIQRLAGQYAIPDK